MSSLFYFLFPLLGFFSVLAIIPPARKLAIKYGFTDKPGGRKHHEDEVPLIGGLVIFPVFMIVGLIAGFDLPSYWSLFLALSLLLVTGALDDKYNLGVWIRFFVQITAATMIVLLGMRALKI